MLEKRKKKMNVAKKSSTQCWKGQVVYLPWSTEVSSKAGCSALAFSGGYRGQGRERRGEQTLHKPPPASLWVQPCPSSSSSLTRSPLRWVAPAHRLTPLQYQAPTLCPVWPGTLVCRRSWDCGQVTKCSLLPTRVHGSICLSPHALPKEQGTKQALSFKLARVQHWKKIFASVANAK